MTGDRPVQFYEGLWVKSPGSTLLGGRGRMSSLPQRASVGALIAEAVLGGARLAPACELLGFSERTFVYFR